MFGIILILLLIFISGLIAYLGDKIGRKIGRKKLSLFGIRPRNTGIIISIVSGILITLFTLLIISIVSQTARDALFNIEKIQKRTKNSQKNLNTLHKDYEIQRNKLVLKEQQVKQQIQLAQKLTTQINNKNLSLKNLQVQLTKVKVQENKIKNQLNNISQKYFTEKNKLEISKKELLSLEKIRENLKNKLEYLNLRKGELEEKISTLRNLGNDAFNRLLESQKQLQATQDNLEKLKNELALTKKELEQYKSQKNNLTTQGNENKKIILKKEGILTEVFISGKSTGQEKRKLVLQSIDKANNIALKKGAKTKNIDEGIIFTETELEQLLTNLQTNNQDIILQVKVKDNVYKNNPAYISFEIKSNVPVFKVGSVLAEGFVHPQTQVAEIQKYVIGLMQTAKEKVIAQGVKLKIDEIQGVDLKEFNKLTTLMSISTVRLKVQILAKKDIFLVDNLEVYIYVKEAPE